MATETNNVNSSPTPETEHLRSLLLGTWLVKAILAHDGNDPSATPIPVFSKHPTGGLLYAQDGYMSAGKFCALFSILDSRFSSKPKYFIRSFSLDMLREKFI